MEVISTLPSSIYDFSKTVAKTESGNIANVHTDDSYFLTNPVDPLIIVLKNYVSVSFP